MNSVLCVSLSLTVPLQLASVASLLALLCFPPFRAQRNGVKRVCGERLQYTISIATILHHPIDDDDDTHTLFRPSCLACTYIVDPACVVVTCMWAQSTCFVHAQKKKPPLLYKFMYCTHNTCPMQICIYKKHRLFGILGRLTFSIQEFVANIFRVRTNIM